MIGEAVGDWFGNRLSSAGDVDGDGLDDILIGAPDHDQGTANVGRIYLFLGRSLAAGGTIHAVDADFTFTGESENDRVSDIASVGDVNGDGRPELAIGAVGKGYLILSGP